MRNIRVNLKSLEFIMPKTIPLPQLWCQCYIRKPEAWLNVIDSNMTPIIQRGDKVLVKRVSPQQICFGDIIVFSEDDKWITHRVIGKQSNQQKITFLQKGDRKPSAQEIVSDSLIGQVTCIRKGDKDIRLDSFLGKCLNFLLGVKSYLIYLCYKHKLTSSKHCQRYEESYGD
jgi:hypothetical protein